LTYDYEAWSFHVAAFERFIDRLNTYGKVILLSGDVHFGFSTVLDYWKGTSATPTSRIVQITASSFKNAATDNVHFLKSGMVQRILTGFNGRLEKMGWKDKVLSTSGGVSPRNKSRLRKATAVIPLLGWRPGTTVSLPPDFRWRLRFLADERSRKENPADPDPVDVVLADPTSVTNGYKQVVLRHQKEFISSLSRRIVWPSNIGLLHFEGSENAWVLKNEFLFNSGTGAIGKHILHSVPLTPPAADLVRPEF
jgi:hypothetical protein